MEYSKYNIFGKLRNSDEHFLVNLLSGQADILDQETAAEYQRHGISDPTQFQEKGYIVEPDDEKRRYRRAYLDFLEKRDSSEIQIFYVPTYACNFACPYCYQEGYEHLQGDNPLAVIDGLFSYIDMEFAGRDKYITVFGGEPLLPGERTEGITKHIIDNANARGLGLAFVTNGYTLKDYIPILKTGSIREIQVTLDGVGEVHDSRRPFRGGLPTFERIVEGIDAALNAGLPINLRVVVDRENISGLVDLSGFAIDRGWTANPLFKTQLGRNYEPHYCQENQSKLYDRLSMYEDIYLLAKTHPELLEFHKPAFSISRFLFENGELPEPLFDSCPGTKTEWAFDYTGRIYSCTATVGKIDEALGTFYPTIQLDSHDDWEDRDVTSIPKCTTCSLQLACGGGCASVAKNASGKILAPDCRPVRELMELGLSLYGDQGTSKNPHLLHAANLKPI